MKRDFIFLLSNKFKSKVTVPSRDRYFVFKGLLIELTMGQLQYYTEEGLRKLKDELQDLKGRGRKDIAKQIAEARDKGDLSENAEYDAAKDAQGHLELKIAKLEAVVGNARIFDQSLIDTSKVGILSTVKIKNVKNGMTVAYTLVSEEEADLKAGKISLGSPFGKGLVGKKKGDIAEINAPAGMLQFEILDITY
jgi:transcription elongation factor GreA